jgi:fatty-acyl-CoA synthase
MAWKGKGFVVFRHLAGAGLFERRSLERELQQSFAVTEFSGFAPACRMGSKVHFLRTLKRGHAPASGLEIAVKNVPLLQCHEVTGAPEKEIENMEIVNKTIGQMLEEIAKKHPNRDALIHTETGGRYNYGLLSWEVERISKGLMNSGIKRGDRVALWAPNIAEWIMSFLALAGIGAIAVPIDPGAGREDLHFILEQSECRAIIMAKGLEVEEYVDTILHERDRIPSLDNIFVIADKSYPDMIPWSELTTMGDEAGTDVSSDMENVIRPEDPVAIMYTSGTTGNPKGVVLDHLGLINKSLFSTQRQGITHEDRLCLFFPLFHMFGNTCIALAGLIRGAAIVMPCQTFDPSRVLDSIHREKCTAVYGSPSMLLALVDHPDFQKKKWRSVLKGTIGGAPCPVELMRRLVEDIGLLDITVAYGITETSSWITMTHPDDPIDLRISTIGTPLECNEVKIVDPGTGEDLPASTQGELCTRGLLMREYYKMPAATAAAIDRDGWFHTGDLGEKDENGYVRITGRLKDVIVREGFEIQPVEVEEVLYQLPEVSEVQVFGFPHPKKGQEVAAWMKVKEGMELPLINVAAHAKDHLNKERMPQYYKIVTEFPMTRSGKVQKFKLAEMAEKEYLEG